MTETQDKNKKSKTKKPQADRSNYWAFIMYPDSAPKNWKDILTEYHLNIIVSPLHNKDINPMTEEPKKPHWHCLVLYESLKSERQVQKIVDSVHGAKPIMCESVNGSIRYMTHIDNPEKAQYKKEDITVIGSYDIDEAFTRSIDKYANIGAMIDYIEDNNITEFFMFLKYCRANNQVWFKALCDSSFLIREYITSKRNYVKDQILNGSYVGDDENDN